MKKHHVLPDLFGSDVVGAIRSKTPPRDFSLRFANIHAAINSASSQPLENTAVAVGVEERIRRMHVARQDMLRRRGSA